LSLLTKMESMDKKSPKSNATAEHDATFPAFTAADIQALKASMERKLACLADASDAPSVSGKPKRRRSPAASA
jgi:hypothetical protein